LTNIFIQKSIYNLTTLLTSLNFFYLLIQNHRIEFENSKRVASQNQSVFIITPHNYKLTTNL